MAGELPSMGDAGIASIDLTGQATERAWHRGENIVLNTGTFTRTDGLQGDYDDKALSSDAGASEPRIQGGSLRVQFDPAGAANGADGAINAARPVVKAASLLAEATAMLHSQVVGDIRPAENDDEPRRHSSSIMKPAAAWE